jgi:nucleoside-diphosphate-sugar epimerase
VYQSYGGAEEHKREYANTVAQFADATANGEAPVLFGDGTQTQDFAHVSGVARAIEIKIKTLNRISQLTHDKIGLTNHKPSERRMTEDTYA